METTYSVARQIYRALRYYIVPFLISLCKLALGGFKFCTRDEAYDRWEICSQCEHYDEERVSCKICGCGVTPDVGGFRRIFEKTSYPNEHCPIGKW